MKSKFKAHIFIQEDINTVWNEISSYSFVKNYLPEVRGNKEPSYIIPLYNVGWSNGFGKIFTLPRKDVKGNLEYINIEIRAKRQNTWITIEVSFSPYFGKNYFLAHKCIRGLFSHKLKVLKQEIERKNIQSQGIPVFA